MASSSNLVFAAVLAVLLVALAAKCDRQGAARRIDGARRGFQSPCGTANQVSHRLGECMEPIFAIVEGRLGEPKGDDDLVAHCNRFSEAEKCVRTTSKDCLNGLHKTSTSAVASAIKRFRTTECKSAESRGKFVDPLKCTVKRGKEVSKIYRNHTGILQSVRDLPNATPEEKLIGLCCVLNAVDRELEREFNRECPKSTPVILSIVHALTDDARSTLCVRPKCNNVLEPVAPRSHYKPPQNFIEPITEILFMLNVE